MPRSRIAFRVREIVLGTGLLLAACGGDGSSSPPPPTGPSGPYKGGYLDSVGGGGALSFTIAPVPSVSPVATMLAESHAVTGAVQVAAGNASALSGTYDASSGLEVHDVTLQYQFAGAVASDGHFEGISVTPGGAGTWAARPGDPSAVQVLCGTYSRCADTGCSLSVYIGSLILILPQGASTVLVNSPDGPVAVPSTPPPNLSFDFGQIHAEGDVSSNAASGTWADSGGSGYTGIWSASTAQCPLAAR